MDQFFKFTSVAVKKLVIVKRLFGNWGHAIVAVAIVKRFKQQSMYGMSAGPKN